MFSKPTYKTGGTNTRKPSKNDRAMVSGVSSILRKIKDKKNRKEVAGDMVKQFNREGVNYNKEKFLKNSRSFQAGGPVKPIYTSNFYDPRLWRYEDSLMLYTLNPGPVEASLSSTDYEIIKRNPDEFTSKNMPIGKKNVRTKTVNGITTTEADLVYKKPVQPIIYKPELKNSRYVKRIEPKEENTTPINTPTPIVQTPRQLPVNNSQMQTYNNMSTEDKKRAVKKYGDPSKVPFQGVDVNQLRREVRTFQAGGTRPPIYVSDPRDPRLRSYNDSFNLYKENFNQLRSERLDFSPKFLKRIPFNSIKDNEYAQDMFERNDAWDRRSKGEVYPEKIKPIYFDINRVGDKTQHSAYYKKPVQPVVVDPLAEIKKIKPMGLRETSMTPTTSSGPMSVNIPMRTRKQLPVVKHTNNYENFDIKVHNTPGERFYREVVTPMKKERARKPAKHTKNYPDTPGRGYKSGGQHGGLDRWFAEKWVDVKSGKPCGRQEGENRAYPACRPSKRVSSKTPKTSSELSSQEKARFKTTKTSSQRIPYNHKRK